MLECAYPPSISARSSPRRERQARGRGAGVETCERTGFLIISGHRLPGGAAHAALRASCSRSSTCRRKRRTAGIRPVLRSSAATTASRRAASRTRSASRRRRISRNRVPRPVDDHRGYYAEHAGGGDELRAQPDSHRARRARDDADRALPRVRAPGARHDARLRRGARGCRKASSTARSIAPLQHPVVPSLSGAGEAAAAGQLRPARIPTTAR